jgi:hypothetical protein
MPKWGCLLVTAVTACSTADPEPTIVSPAAIPMLIDLAETRDEHSDGGVDLAQDPASDLANSPVDLAAPFDFAKLTTDLAPLATTTAACPETATAFASGVTPLATDGNSLYGFAARSIVRVDRDGSLTTLVSDLDTTIDWGLLVDDRYIFWSAALYDDAGAHTAILRAPKSGGAATLLTDVPLGGWTPLAMDETSLYFTQQRNVFSIPKTGGAITSLATANFMTVRVAAVDATHVYWTSADTEAVIERAPKSGGTASIVAQWSSNAVSPAIRLIVADDTHLYAADFGMIRRVDKTTGQRVDLYDITKTPQYGDRMASIAVGPDAVYWSSWPNDTPIHNDPHYWLARVGKDGSGVTALVDQGAPVFSTGLVVWEDSVYFSAGPYRICR